MNPPAASNSAPVLVSMATSTSLYRSDMLRIQRMSVLARVAGRAHDSRNLQEARTHSQALFVGGFEVHFEPDAAIHFDEVHHSTLLGESREISQGEDWPG